VSPALGKLFQMVGPQTKKAPWPNCVQRLRFGGFPPTLRAL